MGDRDRGSLRVGRLNAAQKPLSNDTWCYTERYSKLTILFIHAREVRFPASIAGPIVHG